VCGILATKEVEKGDSECPDVCKLTPNDCSLAAQKHLGWKEHVRAHIVAVQLVILLFVNKSTDTKVDEHSLLVVVDHNIVWLDVSVNDFDYLVAVVEGLKHVNHVQPYIIHRQSLKDLQTKLFFLLAL